jgi:2-methylisocitrate lyase-like PEP mutase family enzyme
MTQTEKARLFANLHVPGKPLILFNIWDAGSAAAVAASGASALATGSHSVAEAQGYADGEALPLEHLLRVVRQIASVSSLPISVDFESGFARHPDALAENTSRLLETGAVGINLEDQWMGGDPQDGRYAVYPLDEQVRRIRAVRQAADAAGLALFINARTDLILREADESRHAGLVNAVVERGQAYAEAGASGFFIPGLADTGLIGKVVEASPLPVNIMVKPGMLGSSELAALGVARLSHGPFPYWRIMKQLTAWSGEALLVPETEPG